MMILYGKRSVGERLKVAPSTVKRVILDTNFKDKEIIAILREKNIPVEKITKRMFPKKFRALSHQGIIAFVEEFKYCSLDDVINKKEYIPIFLDRIYDPQNLGAIIRVCACLGRFSLVIPKFDACRVNNTVLHVASGGENYVNIALVDNLSKTLREMKEQGYWVVGTSVEDSAVDVSTFVWPNPFVLILGSEGKGVRYGINKQVDFFVRIPMSGAKLPLNVSSACSIFCYLISRLSG